VSGQKVFYAKTIDYFDFVTEKPLVFSFIETVRSVEAEQGV